MWKMKSKKGFTLAEALLVVAIIGILSTVIILSVVDYLRSSTKLEYDGYAKSIFVAAQNHLTMAEHEGYLGSNYFGLSGDDTDGVYRFVVLHGLDKDEPTDVGGNDTKSVLLLALPFGSIDETVRSGSYLIRYQKSTAKVLDVFFWKESGRYSYEYKADDYSALLAAVNDNDTLRDFNGSVIGHYGGADADLERGTQLASPQLRLFNEEKLYVLVDNPNGTISGLNTKLVIRGETSGSIVEIPLSTTSYPDPDNSNGFKVILDDVTEKGKHFSELFCRSENSMIPGENITVYAVAYNDSEFTNVPYTSEQTTNSLFGDLSIATETSESGEIVEDGKPTISVSNLRHLENLNRSVSEFNITRFHSDLDAIQVTDLDWDDFASAINPEMPDSVAVFETDSISDSKDPGFEPVTIDYIEEGVSLSYDGQNHVISNLKVKASGYGGLFGSTDSGFTISNLRMEDPTIVGMLSTGSLAGKMNGGAVRNVLVTMSDDAAMGFLDDDPDAMVGITSSNGFAGGLIGETSGTSVVACAAVVNVSSTGTSSGGAGGLVGQASASLVAGCYSSGLTIGGAYDTEMNIFSVKAEKGPVGGLVGEALSSQIDCCYSTCSVYGKYVGGLVGRSAKAGDDAENGSIKHCYCTGLVGTPDSETEIYICGAFAGSVSGNKESDGNNYFSIITYPTAVVGSGSPIGIAAFDQTTEAYKAFVSTGEDASIADPYDDTLTAYYQGRYNLRTVNQLLAEEAEPIIEINENEYVLTHHGDWPAPEIMIVNVEKETP